MTTHEVRQNPTYIRTSYSSAILGTVWAITSIATLSFFARLYIRYHRFARLFWDDLFVTIAWSLSIPLAAQVTVSTLYTKQGNAKDGPQGPIFTNRLLTQFFYYTCLWCIKISFLVFFRKIGGTALRGNRIYWKCVMSVTILTYCALWTMNPYGCFIKKGVAACGTDPNVRKVMPIVFSVACALDILTDLLIMAIPFAILYRVRLRQRQRLILYAIFSLAVITMSVAIVRAVLSTRGMKSHLDVTWLLFLTHVEANTAVIVACLSSLRTLFTQNERERAATAAKRYPISAPIRGKIAHSDSTEALHSTDLQFISPKRSDPSALSDDLKTPELARVLLPTIHVIPETPTDKQVPPI